MKEQNILTELRRLILKDKDITAKQLYDVGIWFLLVADLKAKKRAKRKK